MAQPEARIVSERYRLVRVLGEGGMGTVFLAADLASDTRPVALKRLHASTLSPAAIDSFKAEFEAMTRLRHPNVVEVYDFGSDAATGEHYITLEYIEGTDLRKAALELPGPQRLDLLAQVCRGLEYIHARGLIHNDLKPQNIIVTGTTPPVCKLTDFGLAEGITSAPQSSRGLRGTLQYLAPELIHGGKPDRRSDLYSLGVLFYLILTGRLPFDGEPSQILTRATTAEPEPPSRIEPSIAPAIEHLIMALLSKDPAGRPASAAEVIRRLAEATGRAMEVETPATLASYARSGTFVGRRAELQLLEGILRTAHDRPGECVRLALVSGESGVGKTRLLGQVRHQAQLAGATVATGQCYEGSGSSFHPFVQILRQVAPDAARDSVMAPLFAPRPAERRTGAAAGWTAEHEQLRAIDAATQAILSAAAAGPLLVCVEDLQWADTASLKLLEHLARNAPPAAGLVVTASYRTEEADTATLAEWLPRLERAAEWARVELTRFDRDDVAAMVRGMFGVADPPSELVEALLRETEGNPFFVQVAVESLLEERALARPEAGWDADISLLESIPFPRSITEAIGRRTAHLDPVETLAIEAMAVAQTPVDERLLHEVLDPLDEAAAGAGALETAIESLVRRRLAAREVGADGGLTVRIDHIRIRSHVYESMDWARRSELHGRLGLALEARGGAGVEELAHHFVNSADVKRALDYAESAGRRALELCASERAIAFLESAIELVPPADAARRLGIQLNLADAYRQARQHKRAIETYDRLIRGARAAGLKPIAWKATCHLLDVQSRIGQYDEAMRGAERLVKTLETEDDPVHLAFALNIMSSLEGSRGNLKPAKEFSRRALELRRAAGDVRGTAASLNNLGLIEMLESPTEDARALLEESLDLRRKLSDLQAGAEVLLNIGTWYRQRGDLAGAAQRSEEAAEMARGHRDRWLQAQCEANLAGIYHDQGRIDRALAAARSAVASARAIGDESLLCEGLDCLGSVERDLGNTAAAQEAHERAVAIARRAGLTSQEGYAQVALALDRLRPGAALDDPAMRSMKDMLRKTAKLIARISSSRLQARLCEALGRAALAGGDREEAIQHANAAREAALAGRLTDVEAAADFFLAECLLAGGEAADPEEAASAARRAARSAEAKGLALTAWQAHALIASIEQAAGRRTAEREAITRAAGILEAVADTIEDETIRIAWVGEPRRAEVLRRASALGAGARRGGVSTDDGSAGRALAAMYELSGIINSSSGPEAMLEQLLDVALGIVGAERGLIILVDEATGEQQVRAARDLEDETVRDALAYSHSVVNEAATGRILVALDAHEDDRLRKFKSVSLYAIKSLMCVPMKVRERILGTVYVDSRRQGVPFSDQDLRFLEAFANLAGSAIEMARLNERLALENTYLRREAGERNQYQNIIGKNVKMQAVYDLMEKVSASDLPVLVVGESGTGKELVARALHYSGPRKNRKFLSENVAAIPETLLESTLFGHMRGSFTGADKDQKGLFELADGGTLFLDEIGDMSLPMQSKVLRALQEGEIRPVGGKEPRHVDVRVISATNKDLEQLMKEGQFRPDLFFRLNVVKIALPPLRDRKEDIPLLVDHFLRKLSRDNEKAPRRIEVGALQLLLRYSWPGNVRELENEIQRLAVLCAGEVITQHDVMESGELFEKITSLEEKDTFTPLEELERRQIVKALKEVAGNRGRAAELLGISRATIFRKIRKYGISH